MSRVAAAIALAIAALLMSTPAAAQSSPRAGSTSPPPGPGPYVIDVRAAMSGLPATNGFHPVLPPNALVPKRGFGLDVGAHIYATRLGPARIGFGMSVMRVRGTVVTPATSSSTAATATGDATTPAPVSTSGLSAVDQINVVTTMTVVAPQVSFNFGTRDGWSYLGGGYGVGLVHSAASGTALGPLAGTMTLTRDDGRSAATNYGGGARWYIRDHVAVGFDLRFHRIAALGTRPATKFFVAAVGLSLR